MKFYKGDNEGKQSHSWKFGYGPLTWEIYLYKLASINLINL